MPGPAGFQARENGESIIYINPKYPRQPVYPPVDTHKRLLTLNRGPHTELRVSLCLSSDGKPFTQVRIWTAGENGFWPSKNGTTIRIHELDQILAALGRVKGLIEAGDFGQDPAPDDDSGPVVGAFNGGRSTVPYGGSQGHAGRSAGTSPGQPSPPRPDPLAGRVEAPPWDEDRPQYAERGHRRPTPREINPGDIPIPQPSTRDFDEFGS